MQKYYTREKKGRIKKGGYKNGRGYCGWYTNIDGKKMFLRSLKEYMVAKSLDNVGTHFLTEQAVFDINGVFYKPDFFIYADKEYMNLIKIIEVKDNKKEAEAYFKYKNFFNKIDIDFEVEYNVHKMKKNITDKERSEWVNNFVDNYNGLSMVGENNPMFGMNHSKQTKQKIGEQTRKYMSDPLVKKKHSDSIRSFWKSDKAIKIKKEYSKLRSMEKEKRDLELNKKDPLVDKKCVICNNIFSCRKSDTRKTCKSIKNGCSLKYSYATGVSKYNGDGKKSYKTKLLNAAIKIGIDKNDCFDTFNLKVAIFKEKNISYKNFSMRESVINKYFGDFKSFKKEINKENKNG